jgi:hypothetical protein
MVPLKKVTSADEIELLREIAGDAVELREIAGAQKVDAVFQKLHRRRQHILDVSEADRDHRRAARVRKVPLRRAPLARDGGTGEQGHDCVGAAQLLAKPAHEVFAGQHFVRVDEHSEAARGDRVPQCRRQRDVFTRIADENAGTEEAHRPQYIGHPMHRRLRSAA